MRAQLEYTGAALVELHVTKPRFIAWAMYRLPRPSIFCNPPGRRPHKYRTVAMGTSSFQSSNERWVTTSRLNKINHVVLPGPGYLISRLRLASHSFRGYPMHYTMAQWWEPSSFGNVGVLCAQGRPWGVSPCCTLTSFSRKLSGYVSFFAPLTETRWHEAQVLLQNRGEAWLSRNAVLLSHVGCENHTQKLCWSRRTRNKLLLEPFTNRLWKNWRGLDIVRISCMFCLTWQRSDDRELQGCFLSRR